MPQSYTSLHVHITFSTKHRLPLIDRSWAPRLYSYVGGILRESGCVLEHAGGVEDHVHLLVSLGKQRTVADTLRDIKSNSSRWVHETIAQMSKFEWQTGYGAFTVGVGELDRVRRYINGQREHHRTVTFREEFVRLLEEHHIPYREEYLWD